MMSIQAVFDESSGKQAQTPKLLGLLFKLDLHMLKRIYGGERGAAGHPLQLRFINASNLIMQIKGEMAYSLH